MDTSPGLKGRSRGAEGALLRGASSPVAPGPLRSSPLSAAVFYTAAILGPAAGYLIGGALLNVYTEIGRR